ncbi:hypothetical protein ACQ4PT_067650 [Festuca glaucescens]
MAPSAETVQSVVTTTRCVGHTIKYSFVADRPVTFTYQSRYGIDRAACLAGVQRTDAGHSVQWRDEGSVASGRARTDAGHGVADVLLKEEGLDGAAKLVGVHKIEAGGRARTDAGREKRGESHAGILAPIPFPWPWTSSNEHASIEARIMAGCPVLHYHAAEFGNHPVFWSLLRLSAEVLGAAALWVSGICSGRDPDMHCPGDGPINLRFGGSSNPHVARAPYFPTP